MWQTMDTAPKDGTNVLLYVPGMEPPIRTGRYWLHEDFRHGRLHYRHEGWQADGLMTMDAKPAAWMPEPFAPDAALIS